MSPLRRSLSTSPPLDLFSELPAVLTNLSSLVTRGFAVVDGALPPGGAATVRSELAALHAGGWLTPNATHLVGGDGNRTLLQKAGILEAEPRPGAPCAVAAPSLAAAAVDTALPTMVSIAAPTLDLQGPAFLKAQLNVGGGACFPIHVDSDESVDARRVTAIFYAGGGDAGGENEGEEAVAGGSAPPPLPGALRLWPTLDANRPIDIEPKPGRAIFFAATRMPHRVLPTHTPGRACFSVWLSAARPKPPPAPLAAVVAALTATRADAATARRRVLMEPDARRALASVRLAEDWDASLVEAHPPGAALDAARAVRKADVAALVAAFARIGVDPLADGLGEEANDPPVAWF